MPGKRSESSQSLKMPMRSPLSRRHPNTSRVTGRDGAIPSARRNWRATIATCAQPIIGSLSVQAVNTELVLKVLKPIWNSKPETASRLRGRIQVVLDWAQARGPLSARALALLGEPPRSEWRPGQFPVAERLSRELLCLPIRPDITIAEVDYVCQVVKEFFSNATWTTKISTSSEVSLRS